MKSNIRNLIIVLGDQLNINSELLEKADKSLDMVWMAEVPEEIDYIPTHKHKILFFLSAMRHFRDELLDKSYPIIYHELGPEPNLDYGKSFEDILSKDLKKHAPQNILLSLPGDMRVKEKLVAAAKEHSIPIEFRDDDHFLISTLEFSHFFTKRKHLVQEHFYHFMRKKHHVLVNYKNKPTGGKWNYDKKNRAVFKNEGPTDLPPTPFFESDTITSKLKELIDLRYTNHPGQPDKLYLPVTRKQALDFLDDFIDNRLEKFGKYQDALWRSQSFLYHSRISALLNIKLLSPKEVIEKVLNKYHNEHIPLESVEGFIRQILGWREFVRGIYWQKMPEYLNENYLNAQAELPQFYWDGDTDMQCVKDAMNSVLTYSYAHHIQRLMILGLYGLLYGVNPRKFHEWHMAMYTDAIDWVSLPNTIGMSQFADGGLVGTKPYAASANYINKMSNYCKTCRFDKNAFYGKSACPFNVLYYDFLERNKVKLAKIPRFKMQMNNLARKSADDLDKIRTEAKRIRNL